MIIFKNCHVLNIQILKSVTAFRQGHKKLYIIEFGDKFRNNLTRRFLSIDMKSYVDLCDSSADVLYLELVSLKSALKYKGVMRTTPENTLPFSVLCRLAGINKVSKTGKEYPLKNIKQMLKTKLDAIGAREDMDFDTEWHRTDNPQEPYIVCFLFRNTGGEFNRDVVSNNNRDVMGGVISDVITRRMFTTFQTIYKNDFDRSSKDAFLSWLYDNNKNESEKFNAFVEAYIDLGKRLFIPKNIKEIFAEFLKAADLKTPLDKMTLPKAKYHMLLSTPDGLF